MKTAILGISPGIRTTGMVVMRGREVYDLQARETKKGMLPWIMAQIEKYQVTVIAMKVVPTQQSTEALETLYAEVKQLARNTGIFLSMLSMEAIRKIFGGMHRNKFELFSSISLEFLDREFQYSGKEKIRNIKILEALSCAVCALE
jgi:hypothetical protein